MLGNTMCTCQYLEGIGRKHLALAVEVRCEEAPMRLGEDGDVEERDLGDEGAIS